MNILTRQILRYYYFNRENTPCANKFFSESLFTSVIYGIDVTGGIPHSITGFYINGYQDYIYFNGFFIPCIYQFIK